MTAPRQSPDDPTPGIAPPPAPHAGTDGPAGGARPPAAPRWLGPALWAAAAAAILGPLVLRPVTLGAGQDRGDRVPLATVLRGFDRALSATGWGDGARILVWGSLGVALVAAFALLWIAFSNDG